VREAEVREAARIVGVREIELLPYEDPKLWSAPEDEIRLHLVSAIRRQRPTIVITFDPNGANQHTDHIAISRFAMDAVSAAADERWYPEAGPAHAVERVLWEAPIHSFQLASAPNVRQQPGIDFLIDVAEFREKKQAAARAHRTQYPGLSSIFNSDSTFAWEAFRVGWGPRPAQVPAGDLWPS